MLILQGRKFFNGTYKRPIILWIIFVSERYLSLIQEIFSELDSGDISFTESAISKKLIQKCL